jgi:hypothetical protein
VPDRSWDWPAASQFAAITGKKRRMKTLAEVVILQAQTNICATGSNVSKRLAAGRKLPRSMFALTPG